MTSRPPATPDAKSAASTHYASRRAALSAEIEVLAARSARISSVRGITFLVAAGIGGYAIVRSVALPLAITGGVFGVAFAALVVVHAILHSDKMRLEQRAAWIDRGVARLSGSRAGAPTGAAFAPKNHPYAGDLDVFGEASLFELCCTAETPLGHATLAKWLSAPASSDDVAARQAAARELVARHAFREDVALEGLRSHRSSKPEAGPDRLAAWSARIATSIASRASVKLARVLVPVTVILSVLSSVAGASLGPLRWVWLVGLVVQGGILLTLRPAIDTELAELVSRDAPFGHYRALCARIEAESCDSPRLAALVTSLRGDEGRTASREMGALERIAGFADLRHNGIIHILANIWLLWDVWCAVALERWRDRAGRHLERWLDAVGEIEILASFATLSFENPGFAWPDVRDGEAVFEATALGHPLLSAPSRVTNDVAIAGANPVRALLVTGSNMSGKSTLLRAVGANAVLALAGAPVCAGALRMAPLAVQTSMRITDSLEHGISHFYAELERLKAIVDAVDSGATVLFLLDEIMHGTNSRERRIGAKAVIRHLVERGAIGAATSHDLGLAALEAESGGVIANVHFEEHVEDGRMTFDYALKRGAVTTANALRLMHMIGLPVDPDGPSARAESLESE